MTVIEGLVADPRLVYRHTVEEYHRMIVEHAIEEGAPFELLDGQIVRKLRNAAGEDPMTVGTHHSTVVGRMDDLNPKLKRLGCYLRIQQPITIPPYDEPEPDGAIVRGKHDDYLERHPGGEDVVCVIEVADASLGRDRGYKQRIYADSGLPTYIIINLAGRMVEVYTQPIKGKGRYGQSVTLTQGQSVTFPTASGKGRTIPVKRLLP